MGLNAHITKRGNKTGSKPVDDKYEIQIFMDNNRDIYHMCSDNCKKLDLNYVDMNQDGNMDEDDIMMVGPKDEFEVGNNIDMNLVNDYRQLAGKIFGQWRSALNEKYLPKLYEIARAKPWQEAAVPEKLCVKGIKQGEKMYVKQLTSFITIYDFNRDGLTDKFVLIHEEGKESAQVMIDANNDAECEVPVRKTDPVYKKYFEPFDEGGSE